MPFSDTVFFDDIGYTGEPYGWAEVPDQVALGHLRDEVLPALESEPTFVFAHLGSNHIPWTGLPPIVEDWRTMNTGAVSATGEDLEMTEGQLQDAGEALQAEGRGAASATPTNAR